MSRRRATRTSDVTVKKVMRDGQAYLQHAAQLYMQEAPAEQTLTALRDAIAAVRQSERLLVRQACERMGMKFAKKKYLPDDERAQFVELLRLALRSGREAT